MIYSGLYFYTSIIVNLLESTHNHHHDHYTGCANKKQSLKKYIISVNVTYFLLNLQLSQRRIHVIFAANFVTIFAVV